MNPVLNLVELPLGVAVLPMAETNQESGTVYDSIPRPIQKMHRYLAQEAAEEGKIALRVVLKSQNHYREQGHLELMYLGRQMLQIHRRPNLQANLLTGHLSGALFDPPQNGK